MDTGFVSAHDCPTCGQPMPASELRLNLDSRYATADGRAVRLSPREAEVLAILLESAPKVASYDRLISRLYGVREPDDASGTLCVHIFNLRRALEPLGYQIVNHRDRGYSLVNPIPSRQARHPAAQAAG